MTPTEIEARSEAAARKIERLRPSTVGGAWTRQLRALRRDLEEAGLERAEAEATVAAFYLQTWSRCALMQDTLPRPAGLGPWPPREQYPCCGRILPRGFVQEVRP